MFPFTIPSIEEVENKQKELSKPRLLPTPSTTSATTGTTSISSSSALSTTTTTTTTTTTVNPNLPPTIPPTLPRSSLSSTNNPLSFPPPSSTSSSSSSSSFLSASQQPIPPLTKLSSSTTINIPKPLPGNQPLVLRTGPDVQRYADTTTTTTTTNGTSATLDYVKDFSGPFLSILGSKNSSNSSSSSSSTLIAPNHSLPLLSSTSTPSSSLLHGIQGFTNGSHPHPSTATTTTDPHRPQHKVLQPLQAAKLQLHVNPKQKGNPVLNYIKNVWWDYVDMETGGPDFMMGSGTVALYLSLKYHLLHPDYIHKRIRSLKKDYRLRLLILLIDVEDCEKSLNELTRTTLLSDITLICCSSILEAARYIETYKAYEHKSAKAIQERVEETFLPRVQEVLTTVRSVNKVDVIQLLAYFGSVEKIMNSSIAALQEPPGIGDKKAKRLYETFTAPFDVSQGVPVATGSTIGSKGGNNEGTTDTTTTVSSNKQSVVLRPIPLSPSSSRPKLTITEAFRTAGASIHTKRATSLLEEKNISIDLIDMDDIEEEETRTKTNSGKPEGGKGGNKQGVTDEENGSGTVSTVEPLSSPNHPSKRSKSDNHGNNATNASSSLLSSTTTGKSTVKIIEVTDSSQEN